MYFQEAFERVVGHEGRFGADPKDPGNWTGGAVGAGELRGTKFGISAASYPKLAIAALTLDDAREIYLADYWNRLRLDEMHEGLRYFIFDYAVNSGVAKTACDLQAALGVLRDGDIGPKTLMAIKATSAMTIFRMMFVDRAMVFALNQNDARYGAGWFARLFDVTITTHIALNPGLGGRAKG